MATHEMIRLFTSKRIGSAIAVVSLAAFAVWIYFETLPSLGSRHDRLTCRKLNSIRVAGGLPELSERLFLAKSVRVLELPSTRIRDSDILAELPNLESLDLSGSEVAVWRFLTALPKLKHLDASGTSITEVELGWISESVEALELRGVTIRSFEWTRRLRNLREIDLSGAILQGDARLQLEQLDRETTVTLTR